MLFWNHSFQKGVYAYVCELGGGHKGRKHMQCICSHTNCVRVEGKLAKKEKATASGKLTENNKLYFLMITFRTRRRKRGAGRGTRRKLWDGNDEARAGRWATLAVRERMKRRQTLQWLQHPRFFHPDSTKSKICLHYSSKRLEQGDFTLHLPCSNLLGRIHSLSTIIYLKRSSFPPGSRAEGLLATDVSYNKLVPFEFNHHGALQKRAASLGRCEHLPDQNNATQFSKPTWQPSTYAGEQPREVLPTERLEPLPRLHAKPVSLSRKWQPASS